MQFHSVTHVTTEMVWLEVYLAVRNEAQFKPSDKHLEAVNEANRAADAFDDRFDPSKKELGR